MGKNFKLILALTASILSASAFAGAADIQKKLSENYPNTKITSVKDSPITGIYEVVMGKNVAYTDESGRYMIFGHVFDLKEQKDLTAPVLESLSSLDVSKLPLADSFKRVKGKGERVLYVFSDPDCPFCKQLEPELSKLDNVTIYTFPYPIPSLHPDATRKATAMWCAPDRAKAWDDWFALNVIPDSKPCDTPISRNAALGASLQINGTPTLIFANGVIKPGYIPAAEIEKRLSGSMGATAQTVKSGS